MSYVDITQQQVSASGQNVAIPGGAQLTATRWKANTTLSGEDGHANCKISFEECPTTPGFRLKTMDSWTAASRFFSATSTLHVQPCRLQLA